MKNINFKELVISDVEGNSKKVDISKELGNRMYINADNISAAELGREIYKNGEAEISEDMVDTVCRTARSGFIYPVWSAIEKLLK